MGMGTFLHVSFKINRKVIRICGPVTHNGEIHGRTQKKKSGGQLPHPVIAGSLETDEIQAWDSPGLFCSKYCSDKQVF